ncbi:MAG: hypothetical protein BMS9Abin36_1098 [Gammaproteobacteria bacterium]|nr:MAG: hypothetical protein BMS9Abin36_1098 [Gammaproteobacteria bacterium]
MSAFHKNALPCGEQLAEYQIESVLGYGGFGITYLATDTSLGANVAIKEYLPHDLASRDGQTQIVPDLDARDAVRDYHWGLKRFLQEAQALAKFKHRNIVRVLRFMEANGTAYMVMEYEEGQSLGQYLRLHGNRLDESEMLKIYLPILNGLQAVHEAGLLHLDIKPDNIYLREDGSPMLIDFGSARQALSGHGSRTVLTPGYAPIEQYPDKGKQGPWTDVYAVGASLYRCIKGKRPTESLERYQMILKIQTDPMTPASHIGKGKYQDRFLSCVEWAMQCFPTDRPQSARALQDALIGKSSITNKSSLAVNEASVEKSGTKKRNTHKPWKTIKWLVVLSLLGGGAGAAYYYWPEIQQHWPQWRVQLEQWQEGAKRIIEYLSKD